MPRAPRSQGIPTSPGRVEWYGWRSFPLGPAPVPLPALPESASPQPPSDPACWTAEACRGTPDVLVLELHLTYCPVHEGPVLYLRIRGAGDPGDAPPSRMLPHQHPPPLAALLPALAQAPISPRDHPLLDVPFSFLHPCGTNALFQEVGAGRAPAPFGQGPSFLVLWISSWASLFRPLRMLDLPRGGDGPSLGSHLAVVAAPEGGEANGGGGEVGPCFPPFPPAPGATRAHAPHDL
jgi:hypothetical protein